MKTSNSISKTSRDPVALLIEKELGELASKFAVQTVLNPETEGPIELKFNEVVATGETQDIALLRLTSALLELDDYRAPLVEALGKRVLTELAERSPHAPPEMEVRPQMA